MGKKYTLLILTTIFFGLFIFLYFYLTYFVFFNYDMPRQAIKVQEFLAHGNFLTAQYFSEESVWRNISWGPMGVFYFALFLKISSDPLIVSYFLSVTNLLAIIILSFCIYKYFSKATAILTAFLLLTNPYWLTYIRIIWVPSPMTFFIPVSIFLFFEAFYGKKGWAQVLLPVSWVALFQIYLPTYSFIATSFILSIFFVRLIKIKYLVIGGLLSLFLLTPTIIFYKDNPKYIGRIFEAHTLFTPKEKTFTERFKDVATAFFEIPIGGKFENQTGYGFNEFVNNYQPFYKYLNPFLMIIFWVSLFWNLFIGFIKKDWKRVVIFLWAITPLWSMMVLWVSDILPRYYLLAFPAMMISIALFITDLIKFNRLFWILAAGIIIYFIFFDYSYNSFIQNYSYPYGRFNDVAETPYIYFKKAIGWVISDSKNKNCEAVITNDEKYPNYDIWLETRYVWKYVFNKDFPDPSTLINPCYYVLNYKDKVKNLGINNYKVFGLYTVFNIYPSNNPQTQD